MRYYLKCEACSGELVALTAKPMNGDILKPYLADPDDVFLENCKHCNASVWETTQCDSNLCVAFTAGDKVRNIKYPGATYTVMGWPDASHPDRILVKTVYGREFVFEETNLELLTEELDLMDLERAISEPFEIDEAELWGINAPKGCIHKKSTTPMQNSSNAFEWEHYCVLCGDWLGS